MTRKKYEKNLQKLEKEALIKILLDVWDSTENMIKAFK